MIKQKIKQEAKSSGVRAGRPGSTEEKEIKQ